MCLRPVEILNKTKKLSIEGGQPLVLKVPCGNCAECKKQKRLEWHFRTYHEALECIKHGGFVYFDTLTYSDEHLPHISDFVDGFTDYYDFSCFNLAHLRAFLNRLRSRLSYAYGKGRITFKYFLTSEYGTDERYTHRPHYHILFFIYDNINTIVNDESETLPCLMPVEFSEHVSKAWFYGRTDGYPYHDGMYIHDHVIDGSSATKDILKACNYVSKYITKDSTFQDKIDKRINYIIDKIGKESSSSLIRLIGQFHRQSQGFGISYIKNLDAEEREFIFKNGACRLVDDKKTKIVVRLPLYYSRKLFYKCIKIDDSLHWQPTYDGILYKQNAFTRSINKMTEYYQNVYLNATDTDKTLIVKFLKDRTLEDFSIYKLFYQGRLRQLDTCNYNTILYRCTSLLTDNEYNLYDWLYTICRSFYVHNIISEDVLNIDHDNHTIQTRSNGIFADEILIPYNKLSIKKFTFHENTDNSFAYFDKLDNLFNFIIEPENKQKQNTFDFLEDINKKYKFLYTYGYY